MVVLIKYFFFIIAFFVFYFIDVVSSKEKSLKQQFSIYLKLAKRKNKANIECKLLISHKIKTSVLRSLSPADFFIQWLYLFSKL